MRKANQILEKITNEYPQLSISTPLVEKTVDFLSLLKKRNQTMNLTSIRDDEQMVVKHVLDSLAIVKLFSNDEFEQFAQGKTLDLGSGAGLPGAVLCIFNLLMNLTSIDKSPKKIDFQLSVKNKLGLEGFHPLHANLKKFIMDPNHHNQYNLILARAFDQIQGIFELSRDLLVKNGYLVLWKGRNWQKEYDVVPSVLKNRFDLESKVTYQFGDGTFGGTILRFSLKA
ncbi:MAG: 16S rRNA (guanine(527)-N(7))-methyltransferase RsmG [Deltaproteobacteria bacterium]|nr:16S rRNA (guanine(527)-N(7))-methyltransferase RsmG [Deltaproteobacteria bacterium]